jgi:amino acid transporter
MVGLLVPYTDERLLNGDSADATASPFVIAITDAGIKVLPSIMNVVILISVLSVGNSSVYGASRTLAALADQKQAPQIFGYVDREGRPLVGISISLFLALISYSVASGRQGDVFNWLLALSGLSCVFTWMSICLCHIRFRQAWKKAGHSVKELPFAAHGGVIGSYLGAGFNILVFIAQFYDGIWPVGYGEMTGGEIAQNFFEVYLAAPIIIISYIGYKLWYKTKFVSIANIDIVTGRREPTSELTLAIEAEDRKTWPWWKKAWNWAF